jgi:hypothetical protein
MGGPPPPPPPHCPLGPHRVVRSLLLQLLRSKAKIKIYSTGFLKTKTLFIISTIPKDIKEFISYD